ncbi:glucarate dehydratase [Rhodoferax ferrireducens]|uniref:glucarate dehydratase n=1 Tax=Rhodoferax ferrireducens TaxID=192843 RepID=A0ABU2CAY8_9BURK|nr:glucarate dehydratase family protein [Rhodoferax ferrireducens]MDR7378507.1 glucarate dehydratase [Rhodoferax ferrireducens]
MSLSTTRIVAARVTPIAFRDPPLLNVAGVHEPWALRSIIEVETADGRVGLGESYGNLETLEHLAKIAPQLVGLDPFDLNALTRVVYGLVGNNPDTGATFAPEGDKARASALAAFEVPFLDLQGQILDRPLYQVLGGAVRPHVAYSAYLFYKFAQHKEDPGYPTDDWGEALTPAQLVQQARRMIDSYGFGSIKLKAGVFPPEEEIAGLKALRAAFPGYPLRIDPNGGWSVATTRRIMPLLAAEGLLEYLEDPVSTLEEMGEVAQFSPMPLATNMVTVAFGHIPKTVQLDAVQVILSDHHYWGGLRATQHLATLCRTFGIGISMHSNSHMGISLAAMTHVGVTLPNLSYACDTHYPWQEDEVIAGGKLSIRNGVLAPPPGPGLGVTLDRQALARLHQNYLDCGIRKRDDAKEMRKHQPDFNPQCPRF